jgi:quercetin dioxygenase-like cupin family protein
MKHPPRISEPVRIRPSEVAERLGPPPWHEALLDDGRNWAVLCSDPPGRRTETHAHADFNEWWVVVSGELRWEIGSHPPVEARAGDVVFCPAGTGHSVETIGDGPTLRVAVVPRDAGARKASGGPGRDAAVAPGGPPNMIHTRVAAMLELFGPPKWTEHVVLDDRNKAGFIHYAPGMSSNPHWHPGLDEWWIVLKGELRWRIGSNRPLIEARQGDIVFIPEGLKHGITSVGDDTTVRLAVTPPDMPHIYTDDDAQAPPARD